MHFTVRCVAALAAALLASGAGAADPLYPVAARVRVSPDAAKARFAHPRLGALFSAPNPGSTTELGPQAREAYAAAARRLFRVEGPGLRAEVEIEVVRVSGDEDEGDQGWRVTVEHAVVARTAAGAELGRWDLRAESKIAGPGEGALPAAFERAAADAAYQFERSFATAPAVVAWLGGQRLAPRPVAPPPPVATAQPRLAADLPDRGAHAVYLDVGAGLLQAGDGGSGALLARGGVSSGRFFAQVAGGAWSASFANGTPPTTFGVPPFLGPSSEISVHDIGVDAGPAWRFGPIGEIRAGVGLHWMWGEGKVPYRLTLPGLPTAEASFPFSKLVPSALVALSITLPPWWSLRTRLGMELRRSLASVEFRDAGRDVALAETSAALTIGAELPWAG